MGDTMKNHRVLRDTASLKNVKVIHRVTGNFVRAEGLVDELWFLLEARFLLFFRLVHHLVGEGRR